MGLTKRERMRRQLMSCHEGDDAFMMMWSSLNDEEQRICLSQKDVDTVSEWVEMWWIHHGYERSFRPCRDDVMMVEMMLDSGVVDLMEITAFMSMDKGRRDRLRMFVNVIGFDGFMMLKRAMIDVLADD